MARVLADTNLWLRAADPDARQHQTAVESLKLLAAQGHLVCLCPQVLIEYWAVVTRPKDANGLGWSTLKAEHEVEQLRASYPFLLDRPEIYQRWFELVGAHDIKGKRTHDARHAAFMAVHRLDYLLTFNGSDFSSFPHVKVLDPVKVVAGEASVIQAISD